MNGIVSTRPLEYILYLLISHLRVVGCGFEFIRYGMVGVMRKI